MGDPESVFPSVAALLPAGAVFVLASGVVALAFVEASGVPVAGADFQPVVALFAVVAGAFVPGAEVLVSVAAVAFAAPAGAFAQARHLGRFGAAAQGGSG